MVKHIVMWSFQDSISQEERKTFLAEAKAKLEALPGVVPGLLTCRLETEPLASSTHDFALFCELESQEALEGYQTHPRHVEVAQTIRSRVASRACFDY